MYKFRSIAPLNSQISTNQILNVLNSDRQNDNLKGQVSFIIWVEAENDNLNPMSYLGSHHTQQQLTNCCQYNQNGQKVDYRIVTEDNYLFELIQFKYNEKNELSRIIVLDEDENIEFSINYKYNLKGQITEEYNETKKELYKAVYDINGFIIKITCQSEISDYNNATYIINRDFKNPINITEIVKNENFKTKFDYDKNGNVIKIENFQGLGGKELFSTKEITYDNYQNIIKTVFKNKTRTTIQEFDYIYDDQQNWINSSFYSNGELTSRTTREIGYY